MGTVYRNFTYDDIQSIKRTTYNKIDLVKIITADISQLEEIKRQKTQASSKIDQSIDDSKKALILLENLKTTNTQRTKKIVEMLDNILSEMKDTSGVDSKECGNLRDTIEKIKSLLKENIFINEWYLNAFDEHFNRFQQQSEEFQNNTQLMQFTVKIYIKNLIDNVMPSIKIYRSEIKSVYDETMMIVNKVSSTERTRIYCNTAFSQPPGTKSAELYLKIRDFLNKDVKNMSDKLIGGKDVSVTEMKDILNKINIMREKIVALHRNQESSSKDVRDFLNKIDNCLEEIAADIVEVLHSK